MSAAANGLVVAGICLLVAALVPVRRLTRQLPPGSVGDKWAIATVLILLFIVGYFAYAAVTWNGPRQATDLIVPTIFFFSAVFVLIVCSLSLDTAVDVRRISILEHENITDPLTGIYNRRYLDRRIEEEVSRAQRYDFPLSVLMLDIDHFKKINDKYGHQVGDIVLNRLGQVIAQSVRKSDIVARYGGEEILVIATHTTFLEAAELGERLRRLIETNEIVAHDAQGEKRVVRVTLSIGIAELNQAVDSGHSLIEAADEALYRAKDDGRNQIAISEKVNQDARLI